MSDEALAKMASKGVSAELSLPDAAYAVRMGAMREVPEGRVVTVCEVSELPVVKNPVPSSHQRRCAQTDCLREHQFERGRRESGAFLVLRRDEP